MRGYALVKLHTFLPCTIDHNYTLTLARIPEPGID